MNLEVDKYCSNAASDINKSLKKNTQALRSHLSHKDPNSQAQSFNSKFIRDRHCSAMSAISGISTKEGSWTNTYNESHPQPKSTKFTETKPKTLSKLKKAIILEITRSYLAFVDSKAGPQELMETYNFFRAKCKRLFVQTFLTEAILLYSIELYRQVLSKAEQAEVTFSSDQDALFKVFVVCFFISNKFNDELHFISAEDLAYMAHSHLKTVKNLEIVILGDVLNWKLVSLQKDRSGEYPFLKWDYVTVVRKFKEEISGKSNY